MSGLGGMVFTDEDMARLEGAGQAAPAGAERPRESGVATVPAPSGGMVFTDEDMARLEGAGQAAPARDASDDASAPARNLDAFRPRDGYGQDTFQRLGALFGGGPVDMFAPAVNARLEDAIQRSRDPKATRRKVAVAAFISLTRGTDMADAWSNVNAYSREYLGEGAHPGWKGFWGHMERREFWEPAYESMARTVQGRAPRLDTGTDFMVKLDATLSGIGSSALNVLAVLGKAAMMSNHDMPEMDYGVMLEAAEKIEDAVRGSAAAKALREREAEDASLMNSDPDTLQERVTDMAVSLVASAPRIAADIGLMALTGPMGPALVAGVDAFYGIRDGDPDMDGGKAMLYAMGVGAVNLLTMRFAQGLEKAVSRDVLEKGVEAGLSAAMRYYGMAFGKGAGVGAAGRLARNALDVAFGQRGDWHGMTGRELSAALLDGIPEAAMEAGAMGTAFAFMGYGDARRRNEAYKYQEAWRGVYFLYNWKHDPAGKTPFDRTLPPGGGGFGEPSPSASAPQGGGGVPMVRGLLPWRPPAPAAVDQAVVSMLNNAALARASLLGAVPQGGPPARANAQALAPAAEATQPAQTEKAETTSPALLSADEDTRLAAADTLAIIEDAADARKAMETAQTEAARARLSSSETSPAPAEGSEEADAARMENRARDAEARMRLRERLPHDPAETEAAFAQAARRFPSVQFEFVRGQENYPPAARRDLEARGYRGRRIPRAFVMGGRVYVDTTRVRPSDVPDVVLHEVVGHIGFDAVFPEEQRNAVLDSVWEEHSAEPLFRQVAERYFPHLADALEGADADGGAEPRILLDNPKDRRTVAREFIARIAQSRAPRPSWWRELLQRIRMWFARVFGRPVRITDRELDTMLARQQRAAQGNIPRSQAAGKDAVNRRAELVSMRHQLENAPRASVKAGAFVRDPGQSVQEAAKRYFPTPVVKKTAVGKITIDERSAKNSLAHGYGQKKLDALVTLQRDFDNAVYLGSARDFDGKPLMNHYFAYPIVYDDGLNYVFCRVSQDINENRLYVHEVFVEDEIKKATPFKPLPNISEDELKPHGGVALYKNILQEVLNASPDDIHSESGIDFSIGNLWTGTSAEYERPSLHYVGTGEGAQVYGWGLYATDNRGIAEWYAKKDAVEKYGSKAWTYNGKLIKDISEPWANKIRSALHDNYRTDSDGLIKELKGLIDIYKFRKSEDNNPLYDKLIQQTDEAIDKIQKGEVRFSDLAEGHRHLYRQTWFTNREGEGEDMWAHLLQWHNPVKEWQKNSILDALSQETNNQDIISFVNQELQADGLLEFDEETGNQDWPEYYPPDVLRDYLERYLDFDDATGEYVYKQIADLMGSPKAASEFLFSECGIDGVVYPANQGDGHDGWNYVSFSDTNMRVDERIDYLLDDEAEDARELGIDLDRETQEFRDEFRRYHGTAQWMKVPNGEPTNLDARQWVQVRTPSFKNWAGDWEVANAYNFAVNGNPVTGISGQEFQKDGVPLTEKVTAFYMQKYNGKVSNPELGDVMLDEEGVKDSLGHGIGSLKAAAYAAVPEVIQHGMVYDRQKNWKERGYDTAVLIAPITIGGEKYACEVVVETRSNRQGFYLHEVQIAKELEDAFKTPTEGSALPGSRLIIAQHFDKVKSATKIIDEKGEPLVLYHQTGNEFSEFDPRRGGAGTFDNELPFGIFMKPHAQDIGLEGKIQMPLFARIVNPIYFTNRQALSRYLRDNVKGYAELKEAYDAVDKEYQQKLDALEKEWERRIDEWDEAHPDSSEAERESADKAISRELGEDALMEEWRGKEEGLSARMKELVDRHFRGSGHDGIILEQDKGAIGKQTTKTVIAFDPNQVKSATGNTGAFSRENPDVLYSLDGYSEAEERDMVDILRPHVGQRLAEEDDAYAKYLAAHGAPGVDPADAHVFAVEAMRANQKAARARQERARGDWLYNQVPMWRHMVDFAGGTDFVLVPSERFIGQEFTGTFIAPEFVKYSGNDGRKLDGRRKTDFLKRRDKALHGAKGVKSDEAAAAIARKINADPVDIEQRLVDFFRDLTRPALYKRYTDWKRENFLEDRELERQAMEMWRSQEAERVRDEAVHVLEGGRPVVTEEWAAANTDVWRELCRQTLGKEAGPRPSRRDMDLVNAAIVERQADPAALREANRLLRERAFGEYAEKLKALREKVMRDRADALSLQREALDFAERSLPREERGDFARRIVGLLDLPNTPSQEHPQGRRQEAFGRLWRDILDRAEDTRRTAAMDDIREMLDAARMRRNYRGVPVSVLPSEQARVDRIRKVVDLDMAAAAAIVRANSEEMARLDGDADDPGTAARISDLMEDNALVDMFRTLDRRPAADAERAARALRDIVEGGRAWFRAKLEARRAKLDAMRTEMMSALLGEDRSFQAGGGEDGPSSIWLLNLNLPSLMRMGVPAEGWDESLPGRLYARVEDATWREQDGLRRLQEDFDAKLLEIEPDEAPGRGVGWLKDIFRRARVINELERVEEHSGVHVLVYSRPVGDPKAGIMETGRRRALRTPVPVEDYVRNGKAMPGARSLLKMADGGRTPVLDGQPLDPVAVEFLRQQLADFDAGLEAAYELFNDQSDDAAFNRILEEERAEGRLVVVRPDPEEVSADRELSLTQGAALQCLLTWEQPQYRAGMMWNGWSEESVRQLKAFIKPKFQELGRWMRAYIRRNRDALDRRVFERFGAHLPENREYFPGVFLSRGNGRVRDDANAGRAVLSINPGFLVARRWHLLPVDLNTNAVRVFLDNQMQQAHFLAWDDVMRDLAGVYGSQAVQGVMNDRLGRNVTRELIDRLSVLAMNGRVAGDSSVAQAFGRLYRHWMTSKIALNIGSMVKQWLGQWAYMNEVPAADFMRNFLKGCNPLSPEYREFVKAAKETPYFKARQGGAMDRDLISFLNRPRDLKGYSPLNVMLNGVAGAFTQWGDWAAALSASAFAVYRHAYENAVKAGASPARARQAGLRAWQRATDETQQSGYLKDQNRAQSSQAFHRWATAFLSNPIQVMNLEAQSYEAWRRERTKETRDEYLRRVVVNHLIVPAMMVGVSQLLSHGIDFSEWDWEDFVIGAMLGPLEGAFLAGKSSEILGKYIVKKGMGKNALRESVSAMPMLDDLVRDIDAGWHLLDGDITERDVLEGIRTAGDVLMLAGDATGSPLAGVAGGVISALGTQLRRGSRLLGADGGDGKGGRRRRRRRRR